MCTSTACPRPATTPATGRWTGSTTSANSSRSGCFTQVANLLNLEVDLLFFDTTSIYFELEDPDTPVDRDEHGHALPGDGDGSGGASEAANSVGFRTYGKSKDSRDDLPQIVIGMAVTRDGIPVRVWCWPNAIAFMAVDVESSAQSQGRVVFREFRASSSGTMFRAA